ncbi:hypothetical protein QTO34_017506 [Cnephaeus nilssonii]|uniref:C2H2-type domain-containing protein n=1 Tax=Cnephaeus nilssonii TaxID=3371016 RepID=A0AA40I190_CNENI|nr:hypothetical protein QTO34_017506 [Eptesicus nilssonii]
MSDQDHSMDEMTAVVKIEKGVGGNNGGNGNGGGAFSQARSSSTGSTSSSGGGGGGGQESQPSPLALLAATCSRIESPNENSNNSQGPSQSGGTSELDLTATQLSQGANGWQIISSSSGATPTSKEQSGSSTNGSNGSESSKNRTVSGGQYVVAATSNLQNQQVLTGLPGVMPNIQYQVIPQFQTVDGQQLQFATTGAQVQQDGSGQIQIIPTGANQQIITNRGSGGNIIAAMPNLLQQAVPLQGLANNVLSGQTQYVTNVPVALNGNITLLPVNSVSAATLTPSSQAVTISSSGSQESGSQPVTSGTAISSASLVSSQASSSSFFTNANSYSTTTTTSNMGIMNFTTSGSAGTNSQGQTSQRVSGLQGSDTLNIQQNQTSGGSLQTSQQKEGEQNQQSQQQQILIQPQLVQGGQTLQALQAAPLSGQTFTTQAISQETLQNLQLQAVPNSGPIIIRTPTVGPNGQVIMELSLASMGLVVMEYMMTQQEERKERIAQIPNHKLVGGPGGKHAPAPTVKTVKEETMEKNPLILHTGERGMGTSHAAARERDKSPALKSQVPAAAPAPAAWERDKLHTLRSPVAAAGPGPGCLRLARGREAQVPGAGGSGDPGKKKQHICHIQGCGKVYGKTSHLRAHLRWHTGERPFMCTWSYCGKRFTRSDELQRHKRTHTGEKKFACPECPKRFMRSDHLSKHIKTHQNKKGGTGVALSVGTLPLDSGAGSESSGAATSSALITTNMVAMEAICPEGIARLANSGINVMQVADLQSINISGNGF